MNKVKANISQWVRHFRKEGAVILLESQMKHHPESKKSYLAAVPEAEIKAWGNRIEWRENNKLRTTSENPWEALKKFRAKHNDWMFGYFGYDLKNHIEQLKSENPDLTGAADLYFMVPEVLLEIDESGEVRAIKGEIPKASYAESFNESIELTLLKQLSADAYKHIITKAKHDIFEGNYYEVTLSHPLTLQLKGDGFNLYKKMQALGPVPFGAYASLDEGEVCCASPERFLAKKGTRVWTQPIKGTARRNRETDTLDINRLKNSEKERAENLMIVDLVRNDLSRIAEKDSVKVTKLFEVQSFETVHQMVSTVACEVKEDADEIDIIKACFPMGSMTGAPKIAVLKAIEKYENYKRGVYSGALGYIKPNGDFDLNVLIRTAFVKGDELVYPVGGAITSDSDADAEWKETMAKARAITGVIK